MQVTRELRMWLFNKAAAEQPKTARQATRKGWSMSWDEVNPKIGPVLRQVGGVTRWKHGRPVHYLRVSYHLLVGREWLRAQFPTEWLRWRLSGMPMDLPPPRLYTGCSMDPEEDERLYA